MSVKSLYSGLLWPILALLVATPAGSTAGAACREDVFEGWTFTVCTVDLRDTDLRMFWRGAQGAPELTFGAVAENLAEKGLNLSFAMNGGMYHDDFSPVGLYV
jgi:uncharacterized protein YigE (DUF2233 family)